MFWDWNHQTLHGHIATTQTSDVDTCSPCPQPWLGPTPSFMCSCSSQCHVLAILGLSSGLLVPRSNTPSLYVQSSPPIVHRPKPFVWPSPLPSATIRHSILAHSQTKSETFCTQQLTPRLAQHIHPSLITNNTGIYQPCVLSLVLCIQW